MKHIFNQSMFWLGFFIVAALLMVCPADAATQRNLLSYSNIWAKSGDVWYESTTSNYSFAPDGSYSSTLVNWRSPLSISYWLIKTLPACPSAVCTISFFVKGPSGGSFKMFFNNNSGWTPQVNSSFEQTHVFSGGWSRVSYTLTANSLPAYFYLFPLTEAPLANFEFWGWQYENGSTATNYQPFLGSTFDPNVTDFVPSQTFVLDQSALLVLNNIDSKLGTANTNSADMKTRLTNVETKTAALAETQSFTQSAFIFLAAVACFFFGFSFAYRMNTLTRVWGSS